MITTAQALADLFVTAFVVGLLAFTFGRYYQEWLYRAKHEAPEPLQDAGGHVRVVTPLYDWATE